MAILLMVGRGQEEPQIISNLLDIKATPCKPQYTLAPEDPLLLYACGFEDLRWIRTDKLQQTNESALRALLARQMIGSALCNSVLQRLQNDTTVDRQQQGSANGAHAASSKASLLSHHVPLLQRAREPSMEERFTKAGLSLEMLNGPSTNGLLEQSMDE